MSDKCNICDGSGKKIVVTKHKYSGSPKTSIEWCICMKSKFVSDSKYCKPVGWLGDSYLPLDKIDPRLKIYPHNLSESPNIFITSTDFRDFCFHVKSIIIKYRFSDPTPMIGCCSAISVLQDYYVRQNDGTSPHLSEINKFDLFIITMDTREKNDPLKTCIAQVVYNRICMCKPTWLYIPGKAFTSETHWEYSDDLNALIRESFNKVSELSKTQIKEKTVITQSKKSASNFGRSK